MALPKPEPGNLIQTVRVNGLTYNHYKACQGAIAVGDAIKLMAEPSNLHDRNAVKVGWGGFQIGWVPRDENADIAARLGRGEVLLSKVIQHIPADSVLVIGVYSNDPPRETLLWRAPATVLKTGSGDAGQLRIAACNAPPGSAFLCDSRQGRTSISLHALHEQVGYLRKVDTPDWLTARIDAGEKIYAIRGTDHSGFDFISGRPDAKVYDLPTVTGRAPSKPEIQYFPPKKENTMNITNTVSTTVNNNKAAAKAAGYLEAGRIANNKLSKVAGKALPMMARGYADTPAGRLVLANIAQMAAAQMRPNDPTLAKLTMAMTTAAYQEVIQNFDIEGMLDNLLDSNEIKRALSKLQDDDSEKSGANGRTGKDD
jgi:hypothetical protein